MLIYISILYFMKVDIFTTIMHHICQYRYILRISILKITAHKITSEIKYGHDWEKT